MNAEVIESMDEKLNLSLNSNLKNSLPITSDDYKKKLVDDLEKFINSNLTLDRENSFLNEKIPFNQINSNPRFKRITRKRSIYDISPVNADESFSNINELDLKSVEMSKRTRNLMSSGNSERDASDLILHESEKCNLNDNLKISKKTVSCDSIMTLNLNNHNNSKFTVNEKNIFKDKKEFTYKKKKFSPLDSNQIRFLFKGFFGEDEENLNIEEKQSSGIYSKNFYKNVYNKYNGLTESVACKRKHVCIKLLQILKLFVR
jgi:hypothetical protein